MGYNGEREREKEEKDKEEVNKELGVVGVGDMIVGEQCGMHCYLLLGV